MPTNLCEFFKSSISWLLVFVIVIATIAVGFTVARAETITIRTTHYRLDTGVTFLWKNSAGAWQNGYQPGGSASYAVSFSIGKGYENVKVYSYQPNASKGQQGYFDFSHPQYHWNKTKVATSKPFYDFYYYSYSVNSLSADCGNTYNPLIGNMQVSYSMSFNALGGKEYDLKEQLAKPGGKQQVIDLLGNPSREIIDKMNLLDPASESYSPNVEGYLFFLPIIIQYDEVSTVEIEDPEPGEVKAVLGLPDTAPVGAEYIAEDLSVLDKALTVTSATLEKHYGDGNYGEVKRWPGRKPGENTGGRIEQSESAPCTATYRLTVKTDDGQTSADTRTIRIREEEKQVGVSAELRLPAYTYEGHPTPAEDVSMFSVNGQTYSAERAYAERLASNNFAVLPATAGVSARIDETQAEMVFPHRGNFEGELSVRTSSGQKGKDAKPIEVRKTPWIEDTLSGRQKQNRRQLLTLSVATYPGKPLTFWEIEIRDEETGETVMLTDKAPQQCTQNIKTRAVKRSGSEYFTELQVEFLTKVPDYVPGNSNFGRKFTYLAEVRDSKGDTDEAEGIFTVSPDLPPEPAIGMAPAFLREKGSNTAQIQAEDMTVAKDGDEAERRWQMREAEGDWQDMQNLPGYALLSFGTDKKIGFQKKGVGAFEVRLVVRDRWTEPTLEEFVTAEDHLAGSAEASSLVDNVPPVVSLDLQKARRANIVLMGESRNKGEKEQLQEKKAELKKELLSKKIDADIRIKLLSGGTPEELQAPAKLTEFAAPLGYQANGSVNEGALATADEQLIYDAAYTWPGLGIGDYPTAPVTVTAREPYENGTVWQYVTDDARSFFMAHDDEGRYLYLIYENKTVVLDKETGTAAGELPYALGNANYFTEGFLYAVKDGNVMRINLQSMQKEILGRGSEGAAMVGGRLCFITKGNAALILNALDLATGIAEKSVIWGKEQDPLFSPVGWNTLGIDAKGNIICWQNTSAGEMFRGFRVFGFDGVPLAKIPAGTSGFSQDGLPQLSFDERGENHFAITCESQNKSGTITFLVTAYNLKTGSSASASVSSRNIYPRGPFLGAFEREGKGHFIFGAEWMYVNGYGYFSELRQQTFTFDGNANLVKSAGGLWGLSASDEFGTVSRRLAVFAQGDNTPGSGQYRVKAVGIPQSAEAEESEFLNRYLSPQTVRGDSSTNAEDVLAALKEEIPAILTKTAEGKGGVLSREAALQPGREYHYEYEISAGDGGEGKSRLDAVFETERNAEIFIGKRYYTEAFYREDFDGGTVDPFFLHRAGVENGMGGTFVKHGGNNSNWKEYCGTTTFIVPEGKKALLEFDFQVQADTAGWKSGVLIDGMRFWDSRFIPHKANNYSGHYMHPVLFEAGEHEVAYRNLLRSSGVVNYFVAVDNLTVHILSETPPAEKKEVRREKTEDGWEAVSGNFTVPGGAKSYGAKQMTYNENLGISPSTAIRNQNVYTVTIPEGMMGKTFAFPSGSTQRDDGPMFSLGGKEFYMQPDRNNGPNNRIASGERIFLGDLLGSSTHIAHYAYKSNASIPRFEQYLYEADAAAQEGSVFFDEQKENIFQAEEIFTGKNVLRMMLPPGESRIRNFKLYYVEGGKKTFLEGAENFADKGLQTWAPEDDVSVSPIAVRAGEKAEPEIRIYKKGELVQYGITYSDYEGDPSKKEYWLYEHTPFNDGPHPQAGTVLPAVIGRFDVDGKYTVTHWQEDDTGRGVQPGGNPLYDKLSNRESITFYVEGAAKAPWVTFIATDPKAVREGNAFRIRAGVEDEEKDVLSLTTEVYRQRKLIYTHVQEGIRADAYGRYPEVLTGQLPENAAAGAYEVICTVRDEMGAGSKQYRFTVASEGKITGWVKHTDAWEKNRKEYNISIGKGSIDRGFMMSEYMALSKPRPRGSNVFWSGEKFMLEAALAGEPVKVTARIDGYASYQTALTDTGERNENEEKIYSGSLWKTDMTGRWGTAAPEALTFVFTAEYEGGMKKEHKVQVIMDHQQEYWLLHRLW